MTVYECKYAFSRSVVFDSLHPYGLQPARLLCPWNSPDKNPGVGCHTLLQGIFLTQRLNPFPLHLLHWQMGSLALALSGKPKCMKHHIKNSSILDSSYFYTQIGSYFKPWEIKLWSYLEGAFKYSKDLTETVTWRKYMLRITCYSSDSCF